MRHNCKVNLSRLSILGVGVALSLLAFSPTAALGKKGGGEGTFTGVGLKIPNETVPPGGTLQVKVLVTEPKPILKGRQSLSYASSTLGSASGINLYSPAGDASGVAVLSGGGAQIFLNSPLASLGMDADYPVLTMAIPVRPTAVAGQQVNLTLDPTFSSWIDPASQAYPVELKSGVLTVGGTLSISNIFPGSGVVPARSVISIQGVGFQPTTRVSVKQARVVTTKYVNPNLIRITLSAATDMESRQVRVTNPSTNETATYYSYQRPAVLGASSHPLVARSYPLFARSTWKLAYFRPVLGGTIFSGLALQNLSSSATIVRLDLLAGPGGAILASQLVVLGANTRITRDLREFFPAANPATGTEVRVFSGLPIQVLGLAGDDATGGVLPVDPSSVP
jgi:hypothetical protein